MNRHQSNPFLSDWDDNDEDAAARAAVVAQANAQLAAQGGAFSSHEDQASQMYKETGQEKQRRSSMSQATESGSATTNNNTSSSNNNNNNSNTSQARAGLYKRNMSSFEAASLQLKQHEQQMLEQGGGDSSSAADGTQKDLIAKMTADFQLAIQGNDDQQFDNLSFNPFDPFETIVDDDVINPNSPAPTSSSSSSHNNANNKSVSKFVLPTDAAATTAADDDGYTAAAAAAGDDATTTPAKTSEQRTTAFHDSIDDDEEDLVSTPVRNIKSSPINSDSKMTATYESECEEPASSSNNRHHNDGNEAASSSLAQARDGHSPEQECDSIKKAALFASLLASAENGQQPPPPNESSYHYQQAQNHPKEMTSDNDEYDTTSGNIEPSAHVIKGSPKSAGDNPDRPVSFFDPFETVIDKDALTHLVSESHQQQYHPEDAHADTTKSDSAGHEMRLLTGRVAESVSVETVIENTCASSQQQQRQGVDSNNNANNDSSSTNENNTNNEEEAGGPAAQKDAPRKVANSIALERPRASPRLEPLSSGITPPQPTPAKKRTKPQVTRHKASFQEDSSDSSEEDDRIQIVICPRDASKANDNNGQPIVVPLLPPPPSKSSMRQARERGQVEDMPSPIMSYKSRQPQQGDADEPADLDSDSKPALAAAAAAPSRLTADETAQKGKKSRNQSEDDETDEHDDEHDDENDRDDGAFVIPMTHSDNDDYDGDNYGKPETPLYDDDTSYVLEEYPQKFEGAGWEMMLRYPPKKKLTANRFWKKIFVKLAQVPLAPLEKGSTASSSSQAKANAAESEQQPAAAAAMCTALQIFNSADDKKPMQEIPIQATYTVSEISSQLFDQFGKIFTIKLQYIFYKERVGVRQGQLARFIHTGHIGTSTTSGGHGVDPISIGAIKRMGAPIEHSPQISQIIKLGCSNYEDIKMFKETLEDCLFRMPIHRDRALTTYKTEEVQMAVRDETYVEVNQIGTITKQLARVRLFFLSFLNGMPIVEVGINDFHRQGREIVGRMDILPVVTEEWIRLEAWEMHSTVDKEQFDNPDTRLVKLTPPDATFFELMRFRIRPPRNRELPLQISANMSVTRTKACINCEVMVPGCVSRKHGQIPCENIAIRIQIPECWIYFFREEKHFRMGSKKSVNRRPGKVKGIERFLGGSGPQDFSDDSSLIEVTSGQAKYEHHHHAIVWRAARWPKETQSAYVQNTMKIRLPLTAYDKMPESFYEYVHVEYTMPATTVSHTTLRSISVNPCDDEPPEKYVKYAAKFEYKVKMRLSVNLGGRPNADVKPEASPIVIMKQADRQDDLQREPDSDDDEDDDDDHACDDDTDLK